MSPRPAFRSVPDYLSALAPAQARALRRVLAVVRNAVPGSAREISYGIPAFRRDRIFIYCAAFERHIGIYPPVTDDARLNAALTPYANAKGNLSFRLDEPMPMALIGRVAKALAKQYARTRVTRPKPRARKSGARAATVRRPAPDRPSPRMKGSRASQRPGPGEIGQVLARGREPADLSRRDRRPRRRGA